VKEEGKKLVASPRKEGGTSENLKKGKWRGAETRVRAGLKGPDSLLGKATPAREEGHYTKATANKANTDSEENRTFQRSWEGSERWRSRAVSFKPAASFPNERKGPVML